jgi:YbgC/YbaW family acyl-CoA thioester hydrolase
MIYNKTHIFPFEVSFDLLDPGNAVYHPNYLIICDRARSSSLESAGYPIKELWADGYALAVKENRSQYFKPLRMGQKILVLTAIQEVSGASIQVIQKMVNTSLSDHLPVQSAFIEGSLSIDQKDVFHQVEMQLVCIRLSAFKAAALPDRLIEVLDLPLRKRSL